MSKYTKMFPKREHLGFFYVDIVAHVQGGITNASQLAKNLDVTSTTISRYLDLMVDRRDQSE